MKPSIQTLGQILYSPSQYVIPVFQRNYRWQRPEWEKLWDSLIEFGSGAKTGNHFMGFLVFVPGLAQPGQHTTFHLIDGQQRLTTSSLLLAAIRNIARAHGQGDLADEIHQDYLVHPRKKDEHHFRLLPKERDHDSYLAIITQKGQATGRTADALAYFEEKLAPLAEQEGEKLRALFDTVRQRLEFMCATLETENAYNIFKSLNSTGVPLGPSDLIRNFAFMHVLPDEQEEFDRELWGPLESRFLTPEGSLDEERFSKFFRDYLMAGGKYVSPKDTFATFERRYEATNFDPKEVAQGILDAARNYSIISGEASDESLGVTKALAGLNVLESSTTYPLLLALFDRRAKGIISSEQLALAVEMLRGFILRRFVCNESSRGYGQMFVRALAKENGDTLQTVEAYLLERGWPDDYRFTTSFVEFPLYQRGYTREVLETLERARGHKEPADLGAAQVEHVMPQTLSDAWADELGVNAEAIHADWLHRPGNLTLSAYNQELWNHPFAKKRERYADSNIVITRELANYDHWSDADIRERGRILADEAAAIWMGPKEQMVRPEQEAVEDDEAPGRMELRLLFWTALSDYFSAEHPDLPGFEPRPAWTIRLPSGVRHIGIDLRFSLRHGYVGIDVWFWREASMPLWQSISQASGEYDALLDAKWDFEQMDRRARGRMFLIFPVMDLRKESSWPQAQQWFAEKLSLVYERVVPKLRDEMDRLDKAA
jgi:uncharacterized protein with ParB-like and HNH nuclease domain